MKQIFAGFLSATLLFFALSTGAMATESDISQSLKDPIFRKYVLENFDADQDGKIDIGELSKVEELTLSGLGLTDLEGLVYFPELKTLDCSNNKLTTLDVSKNPKLELLDISSNQVTHFDFSKNPALNTLLCQKNALKSLDMRGNKALVTLDCSRNQLVELMLPTDMTELRLDCSRNQFTDIAQVLDKTQVTMEQYRFYPQNVSQSNWSNPYDDVSEKDWFYEAVGYVTVRDLFPELPNPHFQPSKFLTREKLVDILYRAAGTPAVSSTVAFSDVDAATHRVEAIAWAVEKEVIRGTGSNRFAPDALVSRQDFAVILMRYAKAVGKAVYVTGEYIIFSDEEKIADYAKNAVQTLNKAGILRGVGGGDIDPLGTITRAQAATMLQRYLTLP